MLTDIEVENLITQIDRRVVEIAVGMVESAPQDHADTMRRVGIASGLREAKRMLREAVIGQTAVKPKER